MTENHSRRTFLRNLSVLTAGAALPLSADAFGANKKLRILLVGTGSRGIGFWGQRLLRQYPDLLEFVALSDHNPGRLQYAKEYIGVSCPTYVDFDKGLKESKPDLVIVTTVDGTHHEFIIKGLQQGCDVITEKPMTTDAEKCQAILDAEKQSGRKLLVGFNYRWSPYVTKVKELLAAGTIGEISSVDFSWYLNIHHGASYFRRWNGLMEHSGSLFVHKASHHFDLLNWWLDSDPEEVFAYGSLEHYGKNGPFRGKNCRSCEHKKECIYYWDITKSKQEMKLYVEQEHHDGYFKDACVYRNEIDIYDKMSAQIKYANNTVVNYSLTTYSPYEGWRIAFNGHKGRIEAWLDIPFMKNEQLDQSGLHAAEMNQSGQDKMVHEPIVVHKNWEDYQTLQVSSERAGHGGGDSRLQDKLFKNPAAPDPLKHAAGIRDGAMAVLIGVAARKSIETKSVIKIGDLTSLKPSRNRV